MKTRIISGACFVGLITGFFLIREFVDFRLFNLLLWFFALLGSLEIANAVKKYTVKGAFVLAGVIGGVSVPLFTLIERFFPGYGYISVLGLSLVGVITLLILAKDKKLLCILPAVYPVLPLLSTLVINYMPNPFGFIALLMVFVIAPFADTFAYFLGSLIGGKKLCPKLSPKKTWAGAFGSVIGGVIGALIIYFIFGLDLGIRLGGVLFAIIGLVASVLTIFGDLFASLIKRKVGLKDYGNIMPGHGGVMDRIDGMIIASIFIMVAFLVFRV